MGIFCYQRHINDWKRDTAHLSLLERGVYSELLDIFYLTSGDLPSDINKLKRIIGVQNRAEKAALEYVLKTFFSVENDKLRQKRAEKEIENIKFRSKQASVNAKARYLKNKETDTADAEQRQSGRTANHKPITNNHIHIDNFEQFWKAWQPHKGSKKGNKDPAKKSYMKSIKTIDHDELKVKAKTYCDECKKLDRFTQNVSTWLNQRGWESVGEVIPKKKPLTDEEKNILHYERTGEWKPWWGDKPNG